MTRNLILSLLLVLFLSGCNKSYKYVETVNEKSLLGNTYNEKDEEPVIINAKNDSLAYLKAYNKFCISQKVYIEMQKAGMVDVNVPLRFSLYDSNNNEILISVEQSTLDSIKNSVMSIKSNIGRIDSENRKEELRLVDSVKVQELSRLFTFNKDEFDPREVTWIQPKSAPKYANANGIYCYFMKDINGVSNFRFRIQYYSDDWLFIRKYQFSIDGKPYEFIPNNVETDHGDGFIWEWCDENMRTENEIEILKALSVAKQAKIKFIGRQYYDIRDITLKELKSIRNAIELFEAMGGVL